MPAIDAVLRWPARHAAAGVAGADGVHSAAGPLERRFRWASVTKLLTAMAVLVAIEEGTLAIEQEAGPPGATVRHLLAHASGLAPEAGQPMAAAPGTRRIYSNHGYEVLAETLARASGMSFDDYLAAAVLRPLGFTSVTLEGSPASGALGSVADLLVLGQQLLAPRIIAPATLDEATRVAFPGLAGVLPGFGQQAPNDWGLGPELRDGKSPHWTGRANSHRTFGHFGRAGGFLWVDPAAGLACAALTDRDFGPWAVEAWPVLSDEVLRESETVH